MEHTIKVGFVRRYDESFPEQYVRVKEISEENHPWVGIESLSDGTTKTVHRRFLKPIQTTQEHLQKIGFIWHKYNVHSYFKFANILIGSIAREYIVPAGIVPAGKGLFLSGFRIVQREDYWNDMNKYFPNDIFDQDGFDKAFPDVNELNGLIEFLNNQGFGFKIEDILDEL